MQEQLRLLQELQTHDARLQEFESALKALPEKLKSMRDDLAKVEAMLQAERNTLEETERFRRAQEAELKVEESHIAKAKAKLAQSRTGKDYMAAQREIESSRRSMGEREEEILKLMEAIETTKTSIASHQQDVEEIRKHVEAEEAEINAHLGELKEKADAARHGRDEVATRVNQAVLVRYEYTRQRRGVALAPVRNGVCQGCHMAVLPQLHNMLHRMTSVETCPTCQRIIYLPELVEPQAQKAE